LTPNERIIFLSRQVVNLVEKGESLDSALKKIEAMGGADTTREVKVLRSFFEGGQQPRALPRQYGIYNKLSRLMTIVKASGGDTAKLVSNFSRVFLGPVQKEQFKAFEVGGLFAYLLGVMVVAVICVMTYAIFVLPEFQTLFSNFDRELPRFTQFVLGVSTELAYPFIALVLLFIGANLFLLVKIKENMRNGEFFRSWMVRLPLLSSMLGKYNQFLALRYLDLLVSSGLDNRVALDALEAQFGDILGLSLDADKMKKTKTADSLQQSLDAAAELGTFAEEMQFQMGRLQDMGIVSFSQAKSLISVVAIIFIAVSVGSFVIAMYLPMFQLGRVIG
jgi:type II secretory pathway component PulF